MQSSCAEVPCQESRWERSRSELRGEASSSSSEFVELYHFLLFDLIVCYWPVPLVPLFSLVNDFTCQCLFPHFIFSMTKKKVPKTKTHHLPIIETWINKLCQVASPLREHPRDRCQNVHQKDPGFSSYYQ